MPISVRLDSETEKLLKKASKILGTSKSEVIKKSIRQYCKPIVEGKREDLSDLIKNLIKHHPGSGRGDLALRHEEILREEMRRK